MGELRNLRGGERRNDRGASLVEFAILMPLLLLLLLGVAEFGWALTQHLDVRHVARETGRLATVNSTEAEVEARACNGDVVAPSEITSLLRGGSNVAGEDGTVTVTANLKELTGFFGWVFGGNPTISSTVDFRLEQDAVEWVAGENLAPVTCP